MMKKLPCEIIAKRVLPTARGALAKELVKSHGMTQVEVARLFGVTSAAVSQYLKGFRGGNDVIDRSEYRDDFYRTIAVVAGRVAEGEDVDVALCSLCRFVRACGLLRALYVLEGCGDDPGVCTECPVTDVIVPDLHDGHAY